ncbi:MAG: glycosyltransferase family 39 protein [Candidatus Roizmanbacteria bacterium]|nr:MAG: glycosyltransferase family 39 protein [Candidatus Roizmanbacteria bacterium]
MKIVKKLYEYFPLILLLIGGFWFRYVGIVKNLSFWNDEIHTAIFSRGILWYGKPVTEIGTGTGLYQLPLYYITALSFKIFGISEFAARIPSVIAGTFLIAIVFFITKKIISTKEAYIASFLIAFSQIQLAWSTQLRPYIWIEIFTFIVMFLCYRNITNKVKIIDKSILIAILVALTASLFHGTGLINIFLVATTIFFKSIINRKYSYLILIIPFAVVSSFIFYFSLNKIILSMPWIWMIRFDTLHYQVFLKANYSWLILGAAVGSAYLLFKNKLLFILLTAFVIIIFAFAIFKVNPYYVRYSLPAFPILYVLFSAGIVLTAKILTFLVKNNFWKNIVFYSAIILILFPVIKPNTKIKFIPSYYYTINGDMRENPIVDYKKAFLIIENLIKGKNSVIIMDAINDRTPWYLPKHKYIYLVKEPLFKIDPQFGEKTLSSIKEFEQEKTKYKRGVILIENWESQTSPDLQNHIRNTLKHEADVNNLPYNEADRWSVSIYSWGL